MSSVVPPSAVSSPVSGGGTPVVVTVSGGSAQALAGLAAGTMIEAVAQARASKGVLTVTTAEGTLQLKVLPPSTLPAIPEGARLMLQVGNGATGMALNLVAVNGRALAGVMLPGTLAPALLGAPALGAAVGGNGGATPSASSAPAGMAGESKVLDGNSTAPMGAASAQQPATPGITATLIRPAQASSATPAPPGQGQALPPDLPAGTQLTVRIAGIEAPAAHPAQTVPGNAPAAPSGQNTGQQSAPHNSAPSSNMATTLPLPTGIGPQAAGQMPILTGTVSAHPPGGQAVLNTAIGTLALPTAETMAVGSQIRLEVVGAPQLPANPTAPTVARPEGLTPQGWPALSESMETLAANDRQALDLMMRAIPQAGPRLAAAMVAFTGAMRSGDGRAVIGDAPSKALEKAGRRDLAERLTADLADLAQDSGRPVGNGEWRLHTFPFSHGAQVDPIQLFVRGAEAEEQRSKSGGTGNDKRFILDFNLSSLGRLQMDGLVRREDKLFDLIIRSDKPLPQDVRMDIMAIFTQSSEMVGTKGSVAFQSGGRWIDIRTDSTAPTRIEA